MAYRRRLASEGDMYHVFARGTGRRIIFEDDADRLEFRGRLESLLSESVGCLHAWCLMDNHFHLVANMRLDALAMFVKRLNGGYARFFNERHGRTGHLFEGRYGSEPIKSDAQLLVAVRYVHRNPLSPGLAKTCDYPWSSYREYTERPVFTETGRVLEMCGGTERFIEFHAKDGGEELLDISNGSAVMLRMTHGEALLRAKEVLGEATFENIPNLPRAARDEHLRTLWRTGLSIRQIEVVTGVGRGIVQRAIARR